MDDSQVYHEGELAVQERAGGRRQADELAESVMPFIPPATHAFVRHQRLAAVGSVAEDGSLWASALIADPGFLSVPNEQILHVTYPANENDPLWKNLQVHPQVGLTILDLGARKRIRVNGHAELTAEGFSVYADQVFGNCTKYIQKRIPREIIDTSEYVRHSIRSSSLSKEQQNWIARADTFFIATHHPTAGTDVSHRGGMPGFVQARGPNDLEWGDYTGNNMFQTLGNLSIDPKAGLVFVDFDGGNTLQLSGEVQALWEREHRQKFPGANRLLQFHIHQVIETQAAFSQRWQFLEYSPINPKEDR